MEDKGYYSEGCPCRVHLGADLLGPVMRAVLFLVLERAGRGTPS